MQKIDDDLEVTFLPMTQVEELSVKIDLPVLRGNWIFRTWVEKIHYLFDDELGYSTRGRW